jgi:hypothetical protein
LYLATKDLGQLCCSDHEYLFKLLQAAEKLPEYHGKEIVFFLEPGVCAPEYDEKSTKRWVDALKKDLDSGKITEYALFGGCTALVGYLPVMKEKYEAKSLRCVKLGRESHREGDKIVYGEIDRVVEIIER